MTWPTTTSYICDELNQPMAQGLLFLIFTKDQSGAINIRLVLNKSIFIYVINEKSTFIQIIYHFHPNLAISSFCFSL